MIEKILNTLEQSLKIICGAIIAIIVACLFYAVVMRYVFHQPPAWSMELSRYLFIWMVILSAVLITREQSHIQIVFLVNRLPEKLRFVWLNVIRLLMLAFCWIMIHQGLKILPMVSEASSPTLGISMGWLYLTNPVGGLLMGIYILETIALSVFAYFRNESKRENTIC
ncbi:MAG: TRAP transporter small permease [Desulfobacterales bacterium]|nr:MAG: TRAP transporter small permease [Desulfobacterales bacterium]